MGRYLLLVSVVVMTELETLQSPSDKTILLGQGLYISIWVRWVILSL